MQGDGYFGGTGSKGVKGGPAVLVERRFEHTYAEHYDAILRYCLRRTSHHDAADAAAETFVVAWRRRSEMPFDRTLPWLYGVARKTIANQRRSRARQARLVERVAQGVRVVEGGPEPQVLRGAEDEAVHEALGRLRADDRELIQLAAWEELTREEIAVALGCSPNAATKRLGRAIDRLGRELGARRTTGQRLFERRSA